MQVNASISNLGCDPCNAKIAAKIGALMLRLPKLELELPDSFVSKKLSNYNIRTVYIYSLYRIKLIGKYLGSK